MNRTDTAPAPDTGALVFRDAQGEDVPALAEVIHRAYRVGADRSWTSESELIKGPRTTVPALRELIAAPGGRLLVAERDGAPVGCCRLEDRGGSAHFGMFAVDPSAQATGVGRRILAEAERVARDHWSAREMRMTVISLRAELIAWYVRRGYRRTGELSPFPYGELAVGTPVRADLVFELLVKDLAANPAEQLPPGRARVTR